MESLEWRWASQSTKRGKNSNFTAKSTQDLNLIFSDRTVFFHALASNKEFSVSNTVLKNETFATSTDAYHAYKLLGERGPRGTSQSTAEYYDEETNVLFYTLINRDAIGCWNVNKPFAPETQGEQSGKFESFTRKFSIFYGLFGNFIKNFPRNLKFFPEIHWNFHAEYFKTPQIFFRPRRLWFRCFGLPQRLEGRPRRKFVRSLRSNAALHLQQPKTRVQLPHPHRQDFKRHLRHRVRIKIPCKAFLKVQKLNFLNFQSNQIYF